MTIADLQANEELRRHAFPVARERIFLGHAGVCPLPHCVAEAIRNYAGLCRQGDQEAVLPPELQMPRTRELAARLSAAWRGTYTFDQLSMGTSADYEVAVEEGATIVRVGSVLF